jgi:hypothetical protein
VARFDTTSGIVDDVATGPSRKRERERQVPSQKIAIARVASFRS